MRICLCDIVDFALDVATACRRQCEARGERLTGFVYFFEILRNVHNAQLKWCDGNHERGFCFSFTNFASKWYFGSCDEWILPAFLFSLQFEIGRWWHTLVRMNFMDIFLIFFEIENCCCLRVFWCDALLDRSLARSRSWILWMGELSWMFQVYFSENCREYLDIYLDEILRRVANIRWHIYETMWWHAHNMWPDVPLTSGLRLDALCHFDCGGWRGDLFWEFDDAWPCMRLVTGQSGDKRTTVDCPLPLSTAVGGREIYFSIFAMHCGAYHSWPSVPKNGERRLIALCHFRLRWVERKFIQCTFFSWCMIMHMTRDRMFQWRVDSGWMPFATLSAVGGLETNWINSGFFRQECALNLEINKHNWSGKRGGPSPCFFPFILLFCMLFSRFFYRNPPCWFDQVVWVDEVCIDVWAASNMGLHTKKSDVKRAAYSRYGKGRM